jgi:cob(I)alamin adenosyltransferase
MTTRHPPVKGHAKRKTLKKGYFQIYTGDGKGKTTAALGVAFRAMGHGLRTYIGQFMKGQAYGELKACTQLASLVTIEQYGKKTLTKINKIPEEEDIRLAKIGLERAREAMLSGSYDIMVFDEINTAHFFHLVSTQEMLDIIAVKPTGVEVIFTGRYAPPELVEKADLVTEMKEVKHYYREGVRARKGIER